MNITELEARTEQAFAAGDNTRGLNLLRTLAKSDSSNATVFHRLAVIEEQIGESKAATRAHLHCLRLSKNNPLAYLYAGYWLEKTNQIERAVALYSLGLDIVERTISPQGLAHQSLQAQQRYQAAVAAVRAHLLKLHQKATGTSPACQRIRDARWVQTDNTAQPTPTRQRPHLFYIPNLGSDFDTSRCDWLTALEQQNALVIDEFNAALPQLTDAARPYLSADISGVAGFGNLVGSLNWTALDLFRNGVEQRAITELFPETLALLQNAPLYERDGNPFEVFFSILKAGQRINPHYGLSNHSLTVHLPIDIPPECQLTIDGEVHQWQQGQAIVFDDTLLHEASNNSHQHRIVLIFSIWNPNLSDQERQAVKRTFNARADWLQSRPAALPSE